MRRLTAARQAGGFTTVELLVTIGIFALLTALAVPTLRTVMTNSRIRATAQSLQNGLAMARTEAVRLNTQVEFVLTGAGWSVQRVATGELLQQASGKEMASGITVATTPSGSARVTFDTFGRSLATNPTDSTSAITQVDLTPAGAALTGVRPMRIQLTSSGVARLCDPDPDLPDSDPKVCL